MDATTGRPLEGLDHLRQSIADILSTPIGTRVARRDYGSLLFELLDQPMAGSGRIRLYAAIAVALSRWEKRLRLKRVAIERGDTPGAFTVTIEGIRTDSPAPNSFARLTVPLRTTQ
ncbi:GPW/gp25 family protein [Sphingomonas cavernae]